jgi:hypothetical protein
MSIAELGLTGEGGLWGKHKHVWVIYLEGAPVGE